MKIRFEGAAQTVTGSQTFMSHNGFSLLVDCGLFQGPKFQRTLNWEKPAHLKEVKAMILTHAHIDHSGLFPRWVQFGWRGPVYCTRATADLLAILLLDSARLQEEDARYANKSRHSHHDPALPLYTEEDAKLALTYLRPVDFDQWTELSDSLHFRFVRAGHILGSAVTQIAYKTTDDTRILTMSGDLGGGHSDVLKDPVTSLDTNELVLESTYGDRRVNAEGRDLRLAEIVKEVHGRGGTLIIPVFALGRAQDLLLSLYRLAEAKKIPQIPVYLDSPMANAVTKVYLHHLDELRFGGKNDQIEEALSSSNFHGVESPEASERLTGSKEPKIVLSASGMLQGGRVLHHLKEKLPDPRNGVLFVGFQGRETKGRLLQEGIGTLRLHHQEIPVQAQIYTLDGYSAHGDSEDLVGWLKDFRKKPSRIFLNHGEIEGQQVLAKKTQEQLSIPVEIPELHQEFELANKERQS